MFGKPVSILIATCNPTLQNWQSLYHLFTPMRWGVLRLTEETIRITLHGHPPQTRKNLFRAELLPQAGILQSDGPETIAMRHAMSIDKSTQCSKPQVFGSLRGLKQKRPDNSKDASTDHVLFPGSQDNGSIGCSVAFPKDELGSRTVHYHLAATG